jgi:hypothetical protein
VGFSRLQSLLFLPLVALWLIGCNRSNSGMSDDGETDLLTFTDRNGGYPKRHGGRRNEPSGLRLTPKRRSGRPRRIARRNF